MRKTTTTRASRGPRLSHQAHGQRLVRDAGDVLRHASALSRRPVIQRVAAEMVAAAAVWARLQSQRECGRP